MKLCLLSKENNKCPFCDKDKMECHNETLSCGFQKCEVNESDQITKYVRKERWYEKYYKDSRPKKG